MQSVEELLFSILDEHEKDLYYVDKLLMEETVGRFEIERYTKLKCLEKINDRMRKLAHIYWCISENQKIIDDTDFPWPKKLLEKAEDRIKELRQQEDPLYDEIRKLRFIYDTV